MTNYDQPTGTSGILRMAIDQSGPNFHIVYQIINNSAPTNVGSLPWSGLVNGVPISGAVAINGAGTYTVYTGDITAYGSVSFSFSIAASGTSGLGGPTTAGPVNLNGGSSSAIPGKVPSFKVATRHETSLDYTWGAAASNGSAITTYQIQIAKNNSMTEDDRAVSFDDSLRAGSITGLLGNTPYYSRIRAKNGVGWGPWSGVVGVATDVPAITGLKVTGATPRSITYAWDKAAGTASLDTYQIQFSDNPSQSSGTGDFNAGWNTARTTGLALTYTGDFFKPGIKYYAHVRAQNSAGWGKWSAVVEYTTPAAPPPVLVVVPAADGRSAVITVTPPPGMTVDNYLVERRNQGTTAPVTSLTTTGTATVTGLTPGATYEWRAQGQWTAYGDTPGVTPFTAWQAVFQPSTNTNPGDYFDGNTPDKPDTVYDWDGTANNSTSRATAFPPLGWRTFEQGNLTSGGTGVTVKVTGGVAAEFAARTSFWTDTAVAGFHGGTGFGVGETFDVQVGGTYVGSVYVSPSRPQNMAAEITWLNAARAVVGYSTGSPQLVITDDENLTRLNVSGLAPAGAVFGAVGWTDVAGDDWDAWHAGDSVTADAAMSTVGALLPYFDGDTEDTSQFDYTWLGTANSSASERTTLDFSPPDPLLDPDCPPIPSPPRPPQIQDDCIIPEGEWRRYWAIIGAQEISEWLAVVPTLTVTSGGEPARQVRIRYWANPDGLAPAEFQQTTGWAAEQIVSYMPPNTELTIDGVAERTWASVDGSDLLAADKLLYGTNGTPATWPVLSCGIGYLISLDVPLDAPVGNTEVAVALTRRM